MGCYGAYILARKHLIVIGSQQLSQLQIVNQRSRQKASNQTRCQPTLSKSLYENHQKIKSWNNIIHLYKLIYQQSIKKSATS